MPCRRRFPYYFDGQQDLRGPSDNGIPVETGFPFSEGPIGTQPRTNRAVILDIWQCIPNREYQAATFRRSGILKLQYQDDIHYTVVAVFGGVENFVQRYIQWREAEHRPLNTNELCSLELVNQLDYHVWLWTAEDVVRTFLTGWNQGMYRTIPSAFPNGLYLSAQSYIDSIYGPRLIWPQPLPNIQPAQADHLSPGGPLEMQLAGPICSSTNHIAGFPQVPCNALATSTSDPAEDFQVGGMSEAEFAKLLKGYSSDG